MPARAQRKIMSCGAAISPDCRRRHARSFAYHTLAYSLISTLFKMQRRVADDADGARDDMLRMLMLMLTPATR